MSLFALVIALPVYAATCQDCVIQNVRVFAYPGVCARNCWKQVNARPKGKWEISPATLLPCESSGTYYVVDTINNSWTFTGKTLSIVVSVDCVRGDRKWYLAVRWDAPLNSTSSVLNMSVPPLEVALTPGSDFVPTLPFEHHACRTIFTKSHAVWRPSIVAEDGRVLWSGAIEIR